MKSYQFDKVTDKNAETYRDQIRKIYMQPHVLPYMSFDYLDEKAFKPLFDDFMKDRQIYVIKENGMVVATRSIELSGDGESVEFVSFAVDEKHLGKGYGKSFYTEFEKLMLTDPLYKDVIRVVITQETDNDTALGLASKSNFKFQVEAAFPDWLKLSKDSKRTWLNGERFLSAFITEKAKKVKQSSIASANQFQPKLPLLKDDNASVTKVEQKENKISCYSNDGKLQAAVTVKPGIRRFDHLLFCSIELSENYNAALVKKFLRDLAVKLSNDENKKYKKIEIFSEDPSVINVARDLGFYCRGETIASFKKDGKYYNQVAADLSFFNIEDAKKFPNLSNPVVTDLELIQKSIADAVNKKQIDTFASLYLNNLAFQIVRENVIEKFYKDDKKAPWNSLVQSLPGVLKNVFDKLLKHFVSEPSIYNTGVPVFGSAAPDSKTTATSANKVAAATDRKNVK